MATREELNEVAERLWKKAGLVRPMTFGAVLENKQKEKEHGCLEKGSIADTLRWIRDFHIEDDYAYNQIDLILDLLEEQLNSANRKSLGE